MLSQVTASIAKTCTDFGRDVSDIRLLAVSKNFPIPSIEPLLRAGHRRFAENRVQEAVLKWQILRESYPNIELHLIGALQTNKVSVAVGLFDVIHSLDREKLAKKLATEMSHQGRDLPLFIQVNIGDEPQKAGISLSELSAFHDYCVMDLGLRVVGLMGIPPAVTEPSPYFALLQKRAGELHLPHLSMGMSSDYEIALGFGADYLRIGTALFGKRD